MSRSYKKSPICNDGRAGTTKEMKRIANAAVRHADWDDIPMKGKGYKKYFCSWDIHDYSFRKTLQEALLDWEYNNDWLFGFYSPDDRTKEEVTNDWNKCYRRK